MSIRQEHIPRRKAESNTPARSSLMTMVIAFIFACGLYFIIYPFEIAFAEDENEVNPHQLPDSSFIYDSSIIDLSTADSYFDEQTVQVVGEVIGDSIKVDGLEDYRWITLISQDATTNATVMVYMDTEDAEKIDTFGKYGSTGTLLRVRGTYHLVCADHDGLSDIHAEYVSVVQRGEQHPDELDLKDFIPGAAAILIGLIMLVVYYRIRERRR